jgi:hypothetical protein
MQVSAKISNVATRHIICYAAYAFVIRPKENDVRLGNLFPTGNTIDLQWIPTIFRTLHYQDPLGNEQQSLCVSPLFGSEMASVPCPRNEQEQEQIRRAYEAAIPRRDEYKAWSAAYVDSMRNAVTQGVPGTVLLTVHFTDPNGQYPWNQRLSVRNEELDRGMTLPGALYIMASDSNERDVVQTMRNPGYDELSPWDLIFTHSWVSNGHVAVPVPHIRVGYDLVMTSY